MLRSPGCQRFRRLFVVTAALSVWLYFVVLYHISQPNNYSDYLLRSLDGPIQYDDPELIRFIQQNILEAPSNLPYNFKKSSHAKPESEEFYANFTKAVFGTKRNGVFVEAGALDGQELSNTVALEVKQGWRGLLIEPDPASYVALRRRHRRAWTARACLSVYSHPVKEKLSTFNPAFHGKDSRSRDMGSIVREHNGAFLYSGFDRDTMQYSYYESQCFPLGSLLVAANVTRVDLLSLDVEFIEDRVIKYMDFDRFDIQVLYMEWWKHEKLPWLVDFMNSKGLIFQSNMAGNIIFFKNNSEVHKIVAEKNLRRDLLLFQVPPTSLGQIRALSIVD